MSTPQFSLEYCPMRRRTVLSQSGACRLVLFNSETGISYGLDEIGDMVWGLCDGAHSVSDIINHLVSEYDATVDIIHVDLMELLQELKDKKLLLVPAA